MEKVAILSGLVVCLIFVLGSVSSYLDSRSGMSKSTISTKRPVGRPARLYECKSCGKVMGAAAVRFHKCSAKLTPELETHPIE